MQFACCFRPPDPLAAQIDAYLQELSDAGTFSGAVLVARDGALILRQGYGMASIEHGVPNTPETRFRISSLTKAFTAMAVLQLQDAGRLRLTDPIKLYLSTCPEQWRGITLHQLLTHTSGIPDYVTVPGFWDTSARMSVVSVSDQDVFT
ncbi:MAG: serine hydrolase domain-containing protein, partial [Chloroflexaceae bacterium]